MQGGHLIRSIFTFQKNAVLQSPRQNRRIDAQEIVQIQLGWPDCTSGWKSPINHSLDLATIFDQVSRQLPPQKR
jgi:hypothetical protein